MKSRPLHEAIDLTVRQHLDAAQQRGERRPDPEVIRARIGRALNAQDQKRSQ